MNRKSEYRNIDKWREACYRQRLKYYRKTAYAKNSGKRWTDEEIEIVMKHEIPDYMISQMLGRSVASIQVARVKENKKRSVSDGRS